MREVWGVRSGKLFERELLFLWNFWFLSLGISSNLHFRELDVADDVCVCSTCIDKKETAVLTEKTQAGSIVKDKSFQICDYLLLIYE